MWADGKKELIAIEDGYRESKESWLMVLRDVKARGMRAPVLATGDGALGFWVVSVKFSQKQNSSVAGSIE